MRDDLRRIPVTAGVCTIFVLSYLTLWFLAISSTISNVHYWLMVESLLPRSPGWVLGPFVQWGLFELVLSVALVWVFGSAIERNEGSRPWVVFVLVAAYVPSVVTVGYQSLSGPIEGIFGGASIAQATVVYSALLHFTSDEPVVQGVDSDAVIAVVLAVLLLGPVGALTGLLGWNLTWGVNMFTATLIGVGGFVMARFVS